MISCRKSPDQLFDEAVIEEEAGNYQAAIELLTQAINKNEDYVAGYVNRAFNYSRIEEYQNAIEDNRKVIELDPDNTLALFNLANDLTKLDQHTEAIKFYNKALNSYNSQSSFVDNNTGNPVIIRYNAFEEFDFGVPDYDILYSRGLAYYHLGQWRQCINDLTKSIQMNWNIEKSQYALGTCYIELKLMDSACFYLQQGKNSNFPASTELFKKHCNQ